MRVFRDALRVARMEATLFRRFPKIRFSVLGIILIPAIYVLIYLASVWDPASQTGRLPAAIVDLDQGTELNGQKVALGADLATKLLETKKFGFYRAPNPEAAREDVRTGASLFALIIPADFSASAMAAAEPGAGRLIVFASEGNNYTGAGFARRFADELGHQVNATLNEKRWEAVLGATAASGDGLARMREAVARLREGAVQLDAGIGAARGGSADLAQGAVQLSGGAASLADGVRQLGGGLRALDARKPAPADLQALKDGGSQLAAGHVEFQKAFPRMQAAAGKLAEGAGQLREGGRTLPIGSARVVGAAGQLADGATQLQAAIGQAEEAGSKLGAGALTLSKSVSQMADGFSAYASGISAITARLPDDRKLDELPAGARSLADGTGKLNDGLGTLKNGSSQLAAGLGALAASLPASPPSLPGTSGGLATSVRPEVEIDAPVRTNGMGFAPNFIPVALWLGAVMTAFIFHLRRLPEAAATIGRPARLLGKLGLLWGINIAQALCVLLMCWFLLGLHPVDLSGLAVTMVLSAMTFMLVLLLLVRAFGDTGKGLALILLVLQLSAAGGVMPTELTSAFYRAVSPWLPFTWSIRAVRASMFGALGGDWGAALGVLALFSAGAFALCLVVGRWRFVGPEEHRPALDI